MLNPNSMNIIIECPNSIITGYSFVTKIIPKNEIWARIPVFFMKKVK